MWVKTQVDIITGFLGSGKTHFINSLVHISAIDFEHSVILQCEFGQTEIEPFENLQIVQNQREPQPNTSFLLELIKKHSPNRLIIESNGMNSTAVLIDTLESKELRKVCKLHRIFFVADCNSFMVQYRNYGELLSEQILQKGLRILISSRLLRLWMVQSK